MAFLTFSAHTSVHEVARHHLHWQSNAKVLCGGVQSLRFAVVHIYIACHVPPACTFIFNMTFIILTLPKWPEFLFSVFLELMKLKAYKVPAPLNTACWFCNTHLCLSLFYMSAVWDTVGLHPRTRDLRSRYHMWLPLVSGLKIEQE